VNRKLIMKTIGILFLISFISSFTFINQTNAENQDGVIYGKILDKDRADNKGSGTERQ